MFVVTHQRFRLCTGPIVSGDFFQYPVIPDRKSYKMDENMQKSRKHKNSIIISNL